LTRYFVISLIANKSPPSKINHRFRRLPSNSQYDQDWTSLGQQPMHMKSPQEMIDLTFAKAGIPPLFTATINHYDE